MASDSFTFVSWIVDFLFDTLGNEIPKVARLVDTGDPGNDECCEDVLLLSSHRLDSWSTDSPLTW